MNSNLILDKVKYVKQIPTDLELASELGISHATLASWRRRKNLDTSIIIQRFPDLDFNYIFSDAEDINAKVNKISWYDMPTVINKLYDKIEHLESYIKKHGSVE